MWGCNAVHVLVRVFLDDLNRTLRGSSSSNIPWPVFCQKGAVSVEQLICHVPRRHYVRSSVDLGGSARRLFLADHGIDILRLYLFLGSNDSLNTFLLKNAQAHLEQLQLSL